MDWLTFIASIVSSLAWPMGACGVALIFRSQIRDLFRSINKIRWKDVEAEFGARVDQVRDEVKSIEDDPDYEDRPVDATLLNLVETHPHLAVLEGWKPLERAIIDVSTKRLGTDRSRTVQAHIDALDKSNILPRAMVKAISNVREIRNLAAHEIDANVSKGTAYSLLDTIADITAYLEKTAGKN